jgi:hypothetical protein
MLFGATALPGTGFIAVVFAIRHLNPTSLATRRAALPYDVVTSEVALRTSPCPSRKSYPRIAMV